MEINLIRYWQVLIAILGGLVSFLYGGWSDALMALAFFTTIDYITGVVAAFMTGGLNSKVGFNGIIRKVLIFLVVGAAHFADSLVGSGDTIMTGTVIFYCVNEGLSILENVGRSGVKVPNILRKSLEQLQEKEDGKDGGR